MRIRSVEVWVAKKETILFFFGSFFLLSCISSDQYFNSLLVHVNSLISSLMEKQTALGWGLSEVLTATAKWSNEHSECFSLEKLFFTCFIIFILQSFLFTDFCSQELIFTTCKHILQGYWQDLALCLKVWMIFQSSLSRIFYGHTHITLSFCPTLHQALEKSTATHSL